MTIDEVKEAKRILEKEIEEMIDLFERDTGAKVAGIRRDWFDMTTFGEAELAFCEITLTVEI